MVDEAGAVWIPSPNYFANRNGYTPKWVIVHGTAGFSNARDVGVYFQTADVSSNYVVGQDGTKVQCVAEKDGAWGNGVISAGHDPWWTEAINPNWVTISIEHVKPHTDNSDILTDAQKAASFSLIGHICDRHNIPKRRADASGGITGHYSIDPVNRSGCPGPYPWDELFAFLSSGGNDMIDISDAWCSNYFTDIGNGQWRCKQNGFVIGGNILKYYRMMQAAPRLPLSNEIKNIPGHSEVAYQMYESGVVVYDPNHVLDGPNMPNAYGCYLLKFDSDLAKQLLFQAVQGADPAMQQAMHDIFVLSTPSK